MADTSQDDLLQAVRGWLKTTMSLTDDQVILADEPGPRPDPPFVTVRVTTFDQQLGTDVELEDDEVIPNLYIEGAREDTVSVNCYGRGGAQFLRDAVLRLRRPTVKAQLKAAGVSIHPIGGMNNLSALLDTDTEERWQRDVYIRYRVTSDPEPQVEATTAVVETDMVNNTTFTVS